jgi:hypothetical protein
LSHLFPVLACDEPWRVTSLCPGRAHGPNYRGAWHDIKRITWPYGPNIDVDTAACELKELKAVAEDVRIGRKKIDSFRFRQFLQWEGLPTRLTVRDSGEDFDDEQDLDIFHLDLERFADPATQLKRPRKRQSPPRSTYGPSKKSEEYDLGQSIRD